MKDQGRLSRTLLSALTAWTLSWSPGATGAEKEFREITSEHYVIQTDVPPKSLRSVVETTEALHGEMAGCLGFWQADSERIRIRIFSDRASFNAYAAQHMPQHVGYNGYATPEEIVALMPETSDEAIALLLHEISHKLLYAVLKQTPPWFNEGLACYFGTFSRRLGQPRFGSMHQGRLMAFRKAIRSKDTLKLSDLIRLKPDEFYRGRTEDGGTAPAESLAYTESWALVYFLINPKNKEYRGKFRQYFERLRAGEDGVAAFEKVYGSDLGKLEHEWVSYFWNW